MPGTFFEIETRLSIQGDYFESFFPIWIQKFENVAAVV
jgi:hypothetical protein